MLANRPVKKENFRICLKYSRYRASSPMPMAWAVREVAAVVKPMPGISQIISAWRPML